jgi:hypothetical protein
MIYHLQDGDPRKSVAWLSPRPKAEKLGGYKFWSPQARELDVLTSNVREEGCPSTGCGGGVGRAERAGVRTQAHNYKFTFCLFIPSGSSAD